MSKLPLVFSRTRVLSWLHLLLFPAAGWLLSGGGELWRLVAALLTAAGLLAAAHAHDDHHGRGRDIHRLWFLTPFFCALPPALFLGWSGVVCVMIFVPTVLLHSGPMAPRRLPLAGLLLKALGLAMLCLPGVTEMNRATWSLIGLALLWGASVRLVQEVGHQGQSRSRGDSAAAALLGPRVSIRVSFALLLLAAPVARGVSALAAGGMVVYALAVGLLWRGGLPPGNLALAMRWLGLGWALVVGADLLSRVL